jgi:hypothetical protein
MQLSCSLRLGQQTRVAQVMSCCAVHHEWSALDPRRRCVLVSDWRKTRVQQGWQVGTEDAGALAAAEDVQRLREEIERLQGQAQAADKRIAGAVAVQVPATHCSRHQHMRQTPWLRGPAICSPVVSVLVCKRVCVGGCRGIDATHAWWSSNGWKAVCLSDTILSQPGTDMCTWRLP